MFDPTGAHSIVNQENREVFFLCQTYEAAKSIPSRTVSLQAGQAIFMPLLNWISISGHDGRNDQELEEIARKRINVISELTLTINGWSLNEELYNYRAQSPFFDVDLPEENIAGLPPGHKRAISDGYWIFFTGFKNDFHLSSLGSCSSGEVRIGVNYEVRIH
jgi:hypothetical protein